MNRILLCVLTMGLVAWLSGQEPPLADPIAKSKGVVRHPFVPQPSIKTVEAKKAARGTGPLTTWRTTLRADGYRDWAYCWHKLGKMDPTPTLTAEDGTIVRTSIIQHGTKCSWQDWYFHCGFKIASTTPPGKYTWKMGSEIVGIVTVLPKAQSLPTYTIEPGTSTQVIEERLRNGNVEFKAGRHRITRQFYIPSDRTLTGVGAVLERVLHPGEPAWARMITPGARCTFDGLTFRGPAGSLLFDWAKAESVVMKNCTIEGIGVGEFDRPDFLVQDCKFFRASLNQMTSGTFTLGCIFDGYSREVYHPWTTWGAAGLAVVECYFDRTDRGIVAQLNRGDVSNCLFCSNEFRNVVTQNGGEMLAAEGLSGYTLRDNLYLHNSATNCPGPLFLIYNAKAVGNYVRWLDGDGGAGIWLAGLDDQTDNEFWEFELRGSGISVGPKAVGNSFNDGACIDFRPTWSSGLYYNPVFYDLSKRGVVWSEVEGTNTAKNIKVIGQPVGMKAFVGFANTN